MLLVYLKVTLPRIDQHEIIFVDEKKNKECGEQRWWFSPWDMDGWVQSSLANQRYHKSVYYISVNMLSTVSVW